MADTTNFGEKRFETVRNARKIGSDRLGVNVGRHKRDVKGEGVGCRGDVESMNGGKL